MKRQILVGALICSAILWTALERPSVSGETDALDHAKPALGHAHSPEGSVEEFVEDGSEETVVANLRERPIREELNPPEHRRELHSLDTIAVDSEPRLARHGVQFVLGIDASPGSIVYGLAGESVSRTISASGGEHLVHLEAGHWAAAFINQAGEAGEATAFEVADADMVVQLSAPGAFDMSFTAVNDNDGTRLPGVLLEAHRVDLTEPFFDSDAESISRIETTTDDAGFGQIEGLRFGEYRFQASLPGFESQDFTLSLPGPFSVAVEASGRADLGSLSMTPLTAFSVQLEGYMDWGGGEEFSIAHTHQGERAYFSSKGLARLQLGWFSQPLYLKMWFPGDDQEAIIYLDGGMPPIGEPWIIDVRKNITLEVDVRIQSELLDRLDLGEATLRATFSTERGDSTMLAVAAPTSGVYSIPGMAGTAAMVEFVASIDGQESSLALERVVLEGGRRVACILSVDSLPTRLRVVNADGAPMAGAHLEFRERSGSTSWAFGVTTDHDGEILAALPPNLELSMRLKSNDGRVLAVDRPISWDPNTGALVLQLDWMPPMRIMAIKDGVPDPGVEFELFGDHSDQTFRLLETKGDGRTPPIQIVSGSTPRLRLASADLWMADREVGIGAGDYLVRVYEKGHLSAPADLDTSRIYHVGESQNLKAWVTSGLVKEATGSPPTWLVPSGTYRAIRPDESYWEGSLLPGATLHIP